MKNIYFVRHGATPFTEEPERFCGISDPPLSARGYEQVRQFAKSLAGTVNPSLILHSPLIRAVQTARLLSEKLGCKPKVCEDLCEVDFGCWEGVRRDDVTASYETEYARWQVNSLENPPPHGETTVSIMKRVERLHEALLSEPRDPILIVVHKTLSRIAFGTWLGVSPSRMRSFIDLKPGALGLMELSHDSARLRLLNWEANLLTRSQRDV